MLDAFKISIIVACIIHSRFARKSESIIHIIKAVKLVGVYVNITGKSRCSCSRSI